MIIVQLSGGLGNQLFQWAFGYNLSLKLNTSLYLDQSFYKYQNKRVQQLQSIPRLKNIKFLDHLSLSKDVPQNILTVEEKFGNLLDTSNITIQNNHAYYFIGYWQSPYYLSHDSSSTINILKPTETYAQNIIAKFDLDKKKTISMHIRRTDYLSSDGFHIVQPLKYYEAALTEVGDYDQLLIFSDDTNWCFKNLKFNKQKIITDQYTDIENIWLMSLCHHNIIANSSFSWWGAYINTRSDHRVIAPKTWHGNTDSSYWQHIYDKSWIVI